MKKLFLLATVLSLLMASCSSDEPLVTPIDTPNAKVPVTINVTSNTEFNELKNVSPNDAGVKSMLYVVYDEATGNYKKHRLIKGNDLGAINDTLAKGTYRVLILGASYEMITDSKYGFDFESFPFVNEKFNSASFIVESGGENEFYSKNFILNVSTNTVSESVALDRISAKVEIVPTDIASIPADLKDITFYFRYLETQKYTFSTKDCINQFKTGISSPSEHPIEYMNYRVNVEREELMKVNANNPITILMLPVNSTVTPNVNNGIPITATFWGGATNGTRKTLKTTYTLESNKILRLTGNLFTNPSDTEVSINNEWSAEVVEQTFD